MNESSSPLPCGPAVSAETLSVNRSVETLWRCVWDALVLAILVQIFGSVVIGMVGGVWRRMTPTLPPLFAARPQLEVTSPSPEPSVGHQFHFLQQHRFGLLFGVFLASLVVARFARHLPQPGYRNAAAKLSRIFGRVSDQWFQLVVVNAFTAFVGVIVLQFTSQFTTAHWIWKLFTDLVGPVIEPVMRLLSGSTPGGSLTSWNAWYQGNHFKLIFWLLYSAAICDDLGLPNYKALGRLLWRRFTRHHGPTPELISTR